ncbi:extracellular endoglucanase precursor [Minicystis rosea]|nr:extracellular endoglucanase precursor [Minicystis rosea]
MRRTSTTILAAAMTTLLAGACGSASGTGGPGPTCETTPTSHTGDGTFYDADGSGNCSFDPTGDLMVAAMNHTDYADSAVCGACAHIKGPSGEVTVRIVDQCPECQPGDIDLSPQAFEKLADKSLGRIKIDWTYVPCGVDGNIVYHFKEGSNQWWTAVQIRNATNAIATLEVQKDGQWVKVNRVDYNYFVDEAGMGTGPYSFRVTDVNGAVLTDMGVPFVEAGDSEGAGQFPACGP